MTIRRRQMGISLLGVLIILLLLSFFLSVTIRLLPTWMEGRAVRSALEKIVESSSPDDPLRNVTKRIESTFNTNRIEGIKPDDIKVYRDKGKIIIEANYEARTPLFQNVDAVLMFNDNTFVIE
jgi:hypothetical protein